MLNLLIPLFILIFIGYVMKKYNFVNNSFISQLNRLVYYVALPVLLFSATYDVEINSLIQKYPAGVGYVLTVIAITFIGILVSYKMYKNRRGAFIQAGFRSNMGYLGLPLIATTLGDDSLSTIAILLFTGVIINTIASIVVLTMFQPAKKKKSIKNEIDDIIKNPLIIALILGFLFSALSVELPEVIIATLELIARISLPLILIIVGFCLSFEKIQKNLFVSSISSTFKLILMPSICYVIMVYLFNAQGILLKATVLMAAMPTALITQSFIKEFRADEKLASSMINLSTIAAAITIPIIAELL